MKRHFIYKNGRFTYDSEVPEIVSESDAECDIIHKFAFEKQGMMRTYTPFLPESTSPTIASIDDVLEKPVLEAWCSLEFWNQCTIADWIKVLLWGEGKKDYLLIHAPEDIWKKFSVEDWKKLLIKRADLSKDHYREWEFSRNEWFSFLQEKEFYTYFQYCPQDIYRSFSEEQWQELLLQNPQYYLANAREILVNKISFEFLIKKICSENPELKMTDFRDFLKKSGQWLRTKISKTLEQPRPDFSFLYDAEDKDKGYTGITDEHWLRFSEKRYQEFKVNPVYSEPYNKLKWYIGYWRGDALLAGGVASILIALLAAISGADWLLISGGSIICGLVTLLFCSLTGKTFFLTKKQVLWVGLAGGAAACSIVVLLLLSTSLMLTICLLGILFSCGIICWQYGLKKGIINFRDEKKLFYIPGISIIFKEQKVAQKSLKELSISPESSKEKNISLEQLGYIIPGISIFIVLLTLIIVGVSMWYPARQCLKMAHNFRMIGMKNAEGLYMDRYIARHNQYSKKLKEFQQALKNENLSYALSAYEAISAVWKENPLLPQLSNECVSMLKKLKLPHDQKNINELVRARKLFDTASEKNIATLIDLELGLRHKQLQENINSYRKPVSYTMGALIFKDWQDKLIAMGKLDKNYAALANLKSSISEIRLPYISEMQKNIQSFEKIFDKKFPPEKHIAILRKELSLLNDIFQGFPYIFSEYATLKYAWTLTLSDRKNGLAALKQKPQGAPGFLLALVDSGIHLDKFSTMTDSDIMRSLTIRKPVEAERFFRFLLDRYNFNPSHLYYLLAMSQKEQKKTFSNTLETAILNNFADHKGWYLAWVSPLDQKIPVLERIVQRKMTNWKKAAVILGEKYLKTGHYQKSLQFFRLAGDIPSLQMGMMNKAYFEGKKEKIFTSVRQFMLEFDRVYTNSSTVRPPVDFEYKRCYEFLNQDFLWRYAWASYQHSRTLTERNEARALLEKIKSPEGVYLLAKIDNKGKELPVEAVQAGASASFKKIRLEATKYKLSSSRFSSRDKIDGIRYLFEQGELSPQEKLYAGKFLMKQNDYMNARKIFDSLPESGDKAYQLFRCDLISGNKVSARNNLISALQKKHPVSYDEYKRIGSTENKELMILLIHNKGNGFKKAALDLARILASQKEWLKASAYFKIADYSTMTFDDKCNYGFSLWESGDKSSECFEMCMKLPDERIGANLAWNIYLYLKNKKDTRSNLWLKSAASKGSPEAENERYLFLRRDDSVENIAEKNKLWKNCILRGFKEAILDAVKATAYGESCPVSKDVIVRSGELFYSRLSPADKKKYSDLKDKLGIIKDL